jgi:hypothetical protein
MNKSCVEQMRLYFHIACSVIVIFKDDHQTTSNTPAKFCYIFFDVLNDVINSSVYTAANDALVVNNKFEMMRNEMVVA